MPRSRSGSIRHAADATLLMAAVSCFDAGQLRDTVVPLVSLRGLEPGAEQLLGHVFRECSIG